MKKVNVEVTYYYDLEIDEENEFVKEHDSKKELLEHCATFQFGNGLLVIREGGVVIKNIELGSIEDYEK